MIFSTLKTILMHFFENDNVYTYVYSMLLHMTFSESSGFIKPYETNMNTKRICIKDNSKINISITIIVSTAMLKYLCMRLSFAICCFKCLRYLRPIHNKNDNYNAKLAFTAKQNNAQFI